MQRFVEVAFKLPLAQTFTYHISVENVAKVEAGMRVKAPFNHTSQTGFVVSVHSNPPEVPTLAVEKILDMQPVLSRLQIAMGQWMASFYEAAPGECYAKMVPGSGKVTDLKQENPVVPERVLPLNQAQKQIYEDIVRGLDKPTQPPVTSDPGYHLIHGVTGSGKTEIYIHLILAALGHQRGALLLVPEIALTVQLVRRLESVFGSELVLLHSGLTRKQRFLGYNALLSGHRRVAVGTRSAVFAPVANPGIIILDEEHDPSYKEHSSPRYHARQVAHYRSLTEGALLVLGSATPGIETCYAAQSGPGFSYYSLKERARGAALPTVDVVRTTPDTILSGELLQAIEENLNRREQTILLLNRRGYFPYLYCRTCARAVSCPHCSVTLHFHGSGVLMCHYCGFQSRFAESCPECQGRLSRMGTGTQRVEDIIARTYPEARLERLDADAAMARGAVEESIGRFLSGEIDILLGTQMIAKGLDAPGVTLVGVLQADHGLSLPDFRAGERTFALLTQVAGRSGRGAMAGRVIFEVLNPLDPIILFAREQNYDAFFHQELAARREALYPPFCRLIRLVIRSKREEIARTWSERIAEPVRRHLHPVTDGSVRDSDSGLPICLGPVPAPLSRLHGQYRYHIIIKTLKMRRVRELLHDTLADFRKTLPGDCYLEIDFDPVDLL